MSAQALSHCTRRLARPLYITISTRAIKPITIKKMIRPASNMGILPEAKRERRNAARIKPRWSQVNGGVRKEGGGAYGRRIAARLLVRIRRLRHIRIEAVGLREFRLGSFAILLPGQRHAEIVVGT